MKQQRIMIDGGFTCPNRDGRFGTTGCTYCRNDAFAPSYCRRFSTISEQIEAGKLFFGRRYKEMEYLAYFQSYSGTYAPVDVLCQRYQEALSSPDVKGLIIATRPDCLGDDVLDLLSEFATKCSVKIEIGVESFQDHVLRRVARGHDSLCAVDSIRRVAARGIPVGVHILLGLPGETREQMLQGADRLSSLPVSSVKLHQLQILKDTPMAEDYRLHPNDFVSFPKAEDYLALVREFLSRLRPDIEVERLVAECPPRMLLAPRWGLKASEFSRLFDFSPAK